MKKELFEEIVSNMKSRIKKCSDSLDNIKSKDDLTNMTIKELISLRDFCRAEIGDMTKICASELYHIIGMGNMLPPQQSTFLKLMRKYLSYRSDLKCLASSLGDLNNLPNLPTYSTYKLSVLGNIKLESNTRHPNIQAFEFIDEVSNEDVKRDEDKKSPDRDIDWTVAERIEILPNNTIRVKKSDARQFLDLCGGFEATPESLYAKTLLNQNFLGFLWKIDGDSVFVGSPSSQIGRAIVNRLLSLQRSFFAKTK